MSGTLTIAHYPSDVDRPLTSQLSESSRKFYEQAYVATDTAIKYPAASQKSISQSPQYTEIKRFVETFGLQRKRVLEVGAGAGALQDVVEQYVGLDIAESARANFHKPFVQGSATDLPFANGQFDVIWTVWTLEHVPNPEAALREMRRVVKNEGYLYLVPAWDVPWCRSRGYDVLPISQLDGRGKLLRCTLVPIQFSLPYVALHKIPVHALRTASWWLNSAPTTLHYERLAPNYDQFIAPDSDAVNSLDAFEVALWYRSRGDECVNCATGIHQIVRTWGHPLIIRVHKPAIATERHSPPVLARNK